VIADSINKQREWKQVKADWPTIGPLLEALDPDNDWSKPTWYDKDWYENAIASLPLDQAEAFKKAQQVEGRLKVNDVIGQLAELGDVFKNSGEIVEALRGAGLIPKAVDLHGPAAVGAQQRVGLVDTLDEHGPAAAGVVLRPRCCGLLGGCGPTLTRRHAAPSPRGRGVTPAGLVRVAAVVAGQVLAFIRDVLGKFSQEVERLEELEVAFDAAEEVAAGGVGETVEAVLLGLVEHLAGWRDADQPGEAERAAGHVLGEAVDGVAVAGFDADGAVDVEAGVPPGADLLDERVVDEVLVEQEPKDLVLPEAEERLVGRFGQVDELAVGREGAVGDQGVQVRVEVDELAEGLDGQHAAGANVGSEDGGVGLGDGLPGEGGQAIEQVAMESEEDPEPLGDRPDELAVRDWLADIVGDVHAEEEGSLLATAWADAALLAGEGDEEFMSAVGASNASEAVVQVATAEELGDCVIDGSPPVAKSAGVVIGVDGAEGVEVFTDEAVEVGLQRLARAVRARLGGREADHAERTWSMRSPFLMFYIC